MNIRAIIGDVLGIARAMIHVADNTGAIHRARALRPQHPIKQKGSSMNRPTILWNILALCLVLVSLSSPVNAVEFTDGDFIIENWEFTEGGWGAGGVSSAILLGTGGIPGAYLSINVNLNTGVDATGAMLMGRRAGATYDPAQDGQILSIDYAEDALYVLGPSWGEGQGSGPCLWQDGERYVAYYITDRPNAWTRLGRSSLVPDDFYRVDCSKPGCADWLVHPDFSASGAPIEFGFWRGTSTSNGYDYNITIGLDNWSIVVNNAPSADLSVAKTAPAGPIEMGDTITYDLTVTNAGPGDASLVVLEDLLPPGVAFLSAVPSCSGCSCSETGGLVTCALLDIVSQGVVTVQVNGRVDQMFVRNTASVRWAGADPPENNETWALTEVTCGVAGVADHPRPLIKTLLSQNSPNPFNPRTRIDFSVDVEGFVAIVVRDVAGRSVRRLIEQRVMAGGHSVEWDGRDDRGNAVASGTYLYELRLDGKAVGTGKAILLR